MNASTTTDLLVARHAVCAEQLPDAAGPRRAAQLAALLYVEARVRETGFTQIPCAIDAHTSQKVAVLAWDLPDGDRVDGGMVEEACDRLVDAGLLARFQQWWVPTDPVRVRVLARGPVGARWWQPDERADTPTGRFWRLGTLRRLIVDNLNLALAESELGALRALAIVVVGGAGRDRQVDATLERLVTGGQGRDAAQLLLALSREYAQISARPLAALLAGTFLSGTR